MLFALPVANRIMDLFIQPFEIRVVMQAFEIGFFHCLGQLKELRPSSKISMPN
jgi:hypothetical protein